MSEQLIEVGDGFWNIRGEFRVGGLLNIGTQASLVRRASGRFVMLDAYTLNDDIKAQVDALTDGGNAIEAVIHLHPFHTVHAQRGHEQFPQARLHGTRRHLERFAELPWQPERSESAECAALFADDLEFSVPDGVDFISPNEHLHFSSVLAYHRASRTIHSDDTLMCLKLPGPLGWLKPPSVSFHMTLRQTLQRRAGAATEFRAWATALADRWADAENLCAAHTGALLGRDNTGKPIAERIRSALTSVESVLRKHERKYG